MESEIRNMIITISGEPVSGKGTTVKELAKKLKEQGYSEENIHIISTGKSFRQYFEKIIEFMKESDKPEKLIGLAEDEHMKKILNDKNNRQALTKTIANAKEANLDLEKIDIEDINKSEIFKEIREVVDNLIDSDIKEQGKEINSKKRENEVWLYDSRMAFYNIPESFAVRLTTNPKVAAERLFNDTTRGKEDTYETVEEAGKEREGRRLAEIERYKRDFNVDLEDESNYDLIIDTSYSDVGEIAETILLCEECYRKGKRYGKTWTSPLTMIPCQTLGETWNPQPGSDLTLEDLKNKILEEGYKPEEEIDIYEIDGIKYINDGQHRNFASIWAGKTLIPYFDLMKTDFGKERIKKGWIPVAIMRYVYDHEDFVESRLREQKGDKTLEFHYKDIYPDIFKEEEKTR